MGCNFSSKQEELKHIYRVLEEGKITPVEALSLLRETEEDMPLKTEPKIANDESLKEILKELDSLIGLVKIKKLVIELQAFIEIQKKRQLENLVSESLVLHMIFKGNPGTGKTTVARILGRIFKEIGILQKGHLIEVERADLVGEYIGHTAQKTREQIKKAMGGILFIDEAYSLARGGQKDFGKESIDVLVKSMEDYRENLILILAGYKNEMDYFLKTNPGLRSRFPIHIDFPDYTINELIEISQLMVKKRDYVLDRQAVNRLRFILENSSYKNHDKLGNARLVRNLIERAIRRQAVRLIAKKTIDRDDLLTLVDKDFEGVEEE